MNQRTRTVALLSLLAASSFAAQQAAAPIVQMGPIEATSIEEIKGSAVLHGLSNGGVLLNDVARKRVLLFDPTLANAKVVMDSATLSVGPFGMLPIPGLIPYMGDSALFVDFASTSLLVLGPDGKVARVMAIPNSNDMYSLIGLSGGGAPAADSRGRLFYRAQFRQPPLAIGPNGGRMMRSPPDTAPIVRADFDTRTVDTLATVKLPIPGKMAEREMIPGQPMTSMKMIINPIPSGDEWALLSDGTVAIVRTHDYHVDWIDPDGTRRSSPKMRFDWRRITDEEKQQKTDSMQRMLDSSVKAAQQQQQQQAAAAGAGGRAGTPGMLVPEFTFAPFSEMPDYHPPIRAGSVMADRDGRLWIVPTTSSDAKGGLLYDVVVRTGEVIARVQMPPNRLVAGFGAGGVVYMINRQGMSGGVLERARVTFPR